MREKNNQRFARFEYKHDQVYQLHLRCAATPTRSLSPATQVYKLIHFQPTKSKRAGEMYFVLRTPSITANSHNTKSPLHRQQHRDSCTVTSAPPSLQSHSHPPSPSLQHYHPTLSTHSSGKQNPNLTVRPILKHQNKETPLALRSHLQPPTPHNSKRGKQQVFDVAHRSTSLNNWDSSSSSGAMIGRLRLFVPWKWKWYCIAVSWCRWYPVYAPCTPTHTQTRYQISFLRYQLSLFGCHGGHREQREACRKVLAVYETKRWLCGWVLNVITYCVEMVGRAAESADWHVSLSVDGG